MTDTELIGVVAAAFLGALGSGLAGWWDSHESFNPRIFMGTVYRAILAAVSSPYLQATGEHGFMLWLAAFMAGGFIDSVGNRLQGGIAGKSEAATIQAQLAQLEARIAAEVAARTQGGTP